MDDQQQQLPPEERISYMWSELVKMEDRLAQVNNSLSQGLQKIEQLNGQYVDYFEKSESSPKSKAEIVSENFNNIDQFLKSAIELKQGLEEFRHFIYGNEANGILGFKKELESDRTELSKKNEETTSNGRLPIKSFMKRLMVYYLVQQRQAYLLRINNKK